MAGRTSPYSISLEAILEDWLIRASPQELEAIGKLVEKWTDDDARKRAAEIIARRTAKPAIS